MDTHNESIDILIVEDSRTQAERLRFLLEQQHYKVTHAVNGREALSILSQKTPSLIISDIVMPEIDGFELCKLVKQDAKFGTIPVVLLTTLSESEHIIHALEVGADYFLTKPCDEEFLLSRVALFLKVLKEETKEEYSLAYQTEEGKLNVFSSGKKQMVSLLMSTYENAVEQNKILLKTQDELTELNDKLNEKVKERTAELSEEITLRKKSEERQILINKILSILNRPNEWQKLIKDILNEIKAFTGFDAVGIRLKEGDDFPYFETNGFPAHFVEKEKFICNKNPGENRICDDHGKPCLECFCGSVIAHNTDSTKTFYTEIGSFWTNNSGELIKETSRDDLPPTVRNNCSTAGYASVALIPIKSGNDIVGLLQFNDTQTERFTLDLIQYFEKIGATIGIAYRRVQNEKRIKESEERFRSLYENSTLGIYRSTYDGKILMANPAFCLMLGYQLESEIVGSIKASEVYLKGDERNNFMTIIAVEGIVFGFDSEWKKSDGTTIWVRESAKAIKSGMGEIIYIEGTVEEITQLKKAELALIEAKEKAEEMSRLKSSFLANMSHELRTPLIGILGFTEILSNELNDPEQLQMLKAINQGGQRLGETLNLVLEFSNIEANKTQIHKQSTNVAELAKIVGERFTAKSNEKKLKFEIVLHDEAASAEIDRQLFEGVVINLMNNAIKFTNSGGVTLEVGKEIQPENAFVYLKVSDTGIGIDQKYFAQIFDEFRQVSEGFGRNFEGNGLGLTTAKKITELMGGTISVESAVDVGSTFTVRFPACESAESTSLQDKIGIHDFIGIPQNKDEIALPIILNVDDDVVTQNVIRLFLKEHYEVESASDGNTAIRMAKEKTYAGFLMDINLGQDMDGIDVTKEIKKLPQYHDTPVIAVTAYAMVGDRKEFLEGGCTHYLSKPFSRSVLIDMVKSALRN